MSAVAKPAHIPCSGPSPRSQMSSSSRFQQLLQAKLVAEKGAPPASPVPTTSAPINQAYDHLSNADTVFNPSFMGRNYQHPNHVYHTPAPVAAKVPEEQEDPLSAAFHSVVSERIASMYADTQEQPLQQVGWQSQVSSRPHGRDSMLPPDIPIKQEPVEPWHANHRTGPFPELWATPLQQRHNHLQPDFAQWRDTAGKSPQSVNSTPSILESCSSISSMGQPVTPINVHNALPHQPQTHLVPFGDSRPRNDSLNSLKGSPVSAPSALQPYGLGAFTNMNGQVRVPGMMHAASNGGDGSLNLNGLGGDGGSNGGYDHGYGGDGHGGYGYDGNGHDGYGPPGGDGSNGGGSGGGGGPGDGGPPPPPPKGKKLTLACHFCRRRKLKCDGIKPVCENCAKRGETCVFDEAVRRRGPGRRTKENMHNRGRQHMVNNEGTFSQFTLPLVDNSHSFGMQDQSHDQHQVTTPDLGQMATAAQSAQQHAQYHESGVPSANLPDIDPNIDPALAILGMGIDPDAHSHSDLGPATLAEADPNQTGRGQKRKSDLVGDDDDHKRSKLEDETYEGTLPDHVGDLGVGVSGVSGIPGFEGWNPASLTGEGREGEVDEVDLAKFENDLRRVIQDQADADAEAQASGQ